MLGKDGILRVGSEFSDQPEDRLITVSRIGDAACPYRYFKNYVEIPRQEPPFVSIEVGIGQLFHSHLESQFKKLRPENRRVSLSDAVDVAELLRFFRESMVSGGRPKPPYRIVKGGDSIQDYEERLSQVATNFNRFLRETLKGHKVIEVEGKLEIQTSSCYIRGKYDLLTKDSKGNLVLWDWKTGRVPDARHDDDSLAAKAQLGTYAVWARHMYDQPEVRGAGVFLREGLQVFSETFGPAEEGELLHYLVDWRRRLNKMESYPPKPNHFCSWCSWSDVCPSAAPRNPKRDKASAVAWARDVMKQQKEYVVLDLETTGLGRTDEMVQIAVMDLRGNVRLDELVNPTKAWMSRAAEAVHGISMDDLKGCPTFKDLTEKLRRAIADRNIITYNADFDKRIYEQTHYAAGGGFMPKGRWECAMKQYAKYVGEWDTWHDDYKWLPLPGGDHSAVGDCGATLNVIGKMVRATRAPRPRVGVA